MSENKDLLNKISELEKQLSEAKQQLEKSKNPYVNPNKIEDGTTYYYYNEFGEVDNYDFNDDITDEQLINNCNAFIDEKYMNKIHKKELLMRKLDKFAWDNNGHVSLEDWKDESIVKYFIGYDYDDKYFEINSWTTFKVIGQVYFKSLEVAEKAIKEFEYELLEYFNN